MYSHRAHDLVTSFTSATVSRPGFGFVVATQLAGFQHSFYATQNPPFLHRGAVAPTPDTGFVGGWTTNRTGSTPTAVSASALSLR